MKKESPHLIESGVIMPERMRKMDRYPFGKMEIGNSFKVKPEAVEKVRAAACQYARRHPPLRFSVRFADPTKRNYRCWRVS